MKKQGFTLVELMVVIVIIGILSALAIPRFIGAMNKTKVSEFKPVVKQVVTLQQTYIEEKGKYSSDATGVEIGFLPPANVDGTTNAAKTKGTSRFEYQVQNGSVGGIVAAAKPVNDNVLKDMEGIPLKSSADFGCADTLAVFSVSTSNFASVSNLDVDSDCKFK